MIADVEIYKSEDMYSFSQNNTYVFSVRGIGLQFIRFRGQSKIYRVDSARIPVPYVPEEPYISLMKNSLPHIYIWVLLLFTPFLESQKLWAQEMGKPILQNFSPKDYKASSANYMAVQDRRGLLYFANLRGVLEYDGANWRVINIPKRSTVRSLAVDSTGIVYVGAIGDFGYLEPDSMGRMKYTSLLPKANISDRMRNNQVVVLGSEKGAFFHVTGDSAYYRWKANKLYRYPVRGMQKGFSMFYLDGQLFISSPETGLFRHDDQGKVIEDPDPPFKERYVLDMITYDRDHYLAISDRYQCWLVDRQTLKLERFETSVDDELEDQYFSGINLLNNGNLLVSTVKSGAILLDHEGQEIIRLNESNGLQDRLIISSFQDRQGGVWLCLSKGITYLSMSIPLQVWDESNGLEGLVFSVSRFKGKLYASTAQGVFCLENNQFVRVKGLDIETWELMEIDLPGGEKQLLASTVRGLYIIKGKRAIPAMRQEKFPYIGSLEKSSSDKGILYVNDALQRVSIFQYKSGKWEVLRYLEDLRGRFEQLVEEKPGVIWLIERYGKQRAIRLTLDTENDYRILKRQSLEAREDLPNILSIFKFDGRLNFFTEKGFYTIEEGEKIQELDLPMFPTRGITSLVEDNKGRIFLGRMEDNARWFEILIPDGKGGYEKDSVSLKELDNLDIWGKVYTEADGKAWIGTSEGLFCFYPEKKKKIEDFPLPVIRKIVMGEDSVLFYGAEYRGLSETPTNPELSHHQNAITFYYAAPYFGGSSQAEYSFRLLGQDSEWSAWTSERKKDYTLLPPGEYEFQLRARNQFHQESGITAYTFQVAPPWWKSIWALISYGLLALLLIYATIKFNTQRLHLQNEHLERLVYERTNEIWEQHKEIVKKTVALKRKNEEIATQHDLLEDRNTRLEEAMKKLQAAQTQLVEAEKMASLGQLTAGIAHEINNPINYVKGNINPLKKDFEEIKDLFTRISLLNEKEDLEEAVKRIEAYAEEIDAAYLFVEMEQLLNGIEDGANRTKQIVDGLKIFSRTENDLFKHIDIHKGIDSTLTLLNNRLKDRIRINKDFAELPVVECLPGKLNQVFMNIFVNSIQALEEKARREGRKSTEVIGDISISTKEAHNCLPGKGDCLQIIISDNGPGIPEDIRHKIFDPFFTTKDVGEGTGLGLSITFGIIEKHNGKIKVESKEGKGTTFIISLPFKQEEEKVEERKA